MQKVTLILSAIERGDAETTEELLPAVYEELRQMAARKMAQEKPGNTLQATGLVHKAYLRLAGSQGRLEWSWCRLDRGFVGKMLWREVSS